MKNLICKMIPMIGIALFTTSIISCSSDEDNDLAIHTVAVPMEWGVGQFSTSQDSKNEVILKKLKELKYISSYNKEPLGGYFPLPVDFKQENVKSADKEKVLADLTTKAHAHYAAAVEAVNKCDFNSLVTDEVASGHIVFDLSIENKAYGIDVEIQRPLVWDKVWSTLVADCPIKEMSFKGTKGVVATLSLADGTVSEGEASRTSNLIVIKTSSHSYTFQILSPTQIRLAQYSQLPGGKPIYVTDKDYKFNHKN